MTPLHFARSPLPPPTLSSPSPYSPTPLLSFKPISSSSSSRPKRLSIKVPARDRVIDFGKHRGRMLDTLPSKYLSWVSKNLRARDFEEWAKLADEVLRDPIYQDRLEWESAEKVLSGEGLKASRTESPVSDLLEISDRFGWDNEDKVGWSKVDFELLGTSKGGRIPRMKLGTDNGALRKGEMGIEEKGEALAKERGVGFLSGDSRDSNRGQMGSLDMGLQRGRKLGFMRRDLEVSQRDKMELSFISKDPKVSKISEMGSSFERDSEFGRDSELGFMGKESCASKAKKMDSFKERKVGFLSKGHMFIVGEDNRLEEETGRGRREERRERQRLKRGQQMQMLRREIGVEEDTSDGVGIKKQIGRNSGYSNPFPGREALLDKIHRRED